MDWSLVAVLALLGSFFLWRHSKNTERTKVATDRLESDTRLYRNIKAGMREYQFREREHPLWKAKDGELLFETAHMSAFKVDHFAESRVGFYFKDLEEFGLYGFFAGNDDDVFHSYYRTDRTFQKEEMLVSNEDFTFLKTAHGGGWKPSGGLRASLSKRAITSLASVALAWLMAPWSCGRLLRLPLSTSTYSATSFHRPPSTYLATVSAELTTQFRWTLLVCGNAKVGNELALRHGCASRLPNRPTNVRAI